MNYLLARVDIKTSESLDQLADELGRIAGFAFAKDVEGRFDEVPAYIAALGEMEFVLFGAPLDEDHADEIELRFCCYTERTLDELLENGRATFIGKFVGEKSMNARGILDYSDELAALLSSCGIQNCAPIRAVPAV